VNPGRILKVTGEFKESSGSTVTIGNREIKLDDIIVEDPNHRDRFDRTKTMKRRQELVRERQREYDMAKSETRNRYYVTFQEAELAANTAVNEERGYVFRGAEWHSPEELGRQLLQEAGNQP
jgi:hypothetical protein